MSWLRAPPASPSARCSSRLTRPDRHGAPATAAGADRQRATPATTDSPEPAARRQPSACDIDGYTAEPAGSPHRRADGALASAPDGAFSCASRPGARILDAATIEALAADPRRAVAGGHGPYRIDRWKEGERRSSSQRRRRRPSHSPDTGPPLAADATQRTFELQSATVDGIDAPGPLDLERIVTQPELAVVPRAGMATAYLAFGNEDAFDDARVRRAIAASLDRAVLAAEVFPSGSVTATHTVPCGVPGGCAGEAWYEFNAPAAAADLAAAGFDLQGSYTIHVANRAVAGLANPTVVAQAIAAQLRENLGLEIAIDVMSSRNLATEVAQGTLEGMYVSATSARRGPGGVPRPLFGEAKATPATRAPACEVCRGGASADPAGARPVPAGQRRDPRLRPHHPAGVAGVGRGLPRRRRRGDHVAAGHRSPRFVHARRPAAARVHAGRRAGRCLLR
jgi:hypothetical protein